MKTYENLTKLEREKLATYQRYCININITTLIFNIFGLTILLVGSCMTTLFKDIVPVIVGMYLIFIGITIVIMISFMSIRSRKELFLVFGYKNSIKDLFEITLMDIKNVIIEHKTIWRKK